MKAFVYARPKLYTKQQAALFCAERYSWIEGSTKSGKTAGCMAWLVEQAFMLGKPGREFWWVAPVLGTAKIAFSRITRGLPKAHIKVNYSDLTITLTANGAVLRFKSGEVPDNLYGEDVWACVMDEASRMRKEAFYAVRSTLTATRGQIRIIGNVKGRKNWFYIGSRKAEAGEPNHAYHKIIATDAVAAGIFPQSELDDAKAALPEAVFRELYLCEPSDDGGNPFGLAAIKRNIRVVSTKPAVVYGVDLAKSVDWTVIIGLDEDGAVCVLMRFQLPWKETIDRVRMVCGHVPTFVDGTGVGDPIVEALQRGGTGGNFSSYKFSMQSKQVLMEGLSIAIQRGEVYYPEGVIVSELEAFEYEYTRTGVRYTAPEGMHDDCVVSLSLAVYGKNNRPAVPQLIVME